MRDYREPLPQELLMPRKTRRANAVRLEFRPQGLVHTNLSGAAFSGEDWLWVAGDEAAGIERLRRLPPVGDEQLRFGEAAEFPLHQLLALPGEADEEADLEGLDEVDGWLWLVGSHGLKRKNAKPGRAHADNAKRLAKLGLDGNRRLLACVPVEADEQGQPRPVRQAADGRRAALLPGDAKNNLLTQLLADDPHFGPFLRIPGKDNGLDIEGLAVFGDRLLLGLRGPVLRGWTGLLELRLQRKGSQLRLAPLDGSGLLLRKHFLQLDGLGVRDLHFEGDELYLLAGPTMVLDGAIRLYRWAGARPLLEANREPVRFESSLLSAVELPHGAGCDRAEAITAVPGQRQWLVLYDAPAASRCEGDWTVFGDLLARSGS
jgi:hypothetical protein